MKFFVDEKGCVTETSFTAQGQTTLSVTFAKMFTKKALGVSDLHWIEEIPGKRWRGYTYPPGKLVCPGITCSVALIIAEE